MMVAEPDVNHAAIIGPGQGKTVVAMLSAKWYEKHKPSSVAIVCYNKGLKEQMDLFKKLYCPDAKFQIVEISHLSVVHRFNVMIYDEFDAMLDEYLLSIREG